jgi:hypothetical protein
MGRPKSVRGVPEDSLPLRPGATVRAAVRIREQNEVASAAGNES